MKNLAITSPSPIQVTINGRPIETLPGKTILQTLLDLGIHIPHLCYDTRLTTSNGSCGLCVVQLESEDRFVKACQTPLQAGMAIQTTNPALEAYRKVRLEQILGDHHADCVAPCVTTCPAGIDIQAYMRQAGNGNFAAALRIIKNRNPLPACTGRVCPHTCEAACRRQLTDEPLAINHVKRFVADWDLAQERPFSPEVKPSSGKRIAIVGAGPSGLAAAYYSAINGHDVTIFESQPQAGGMLRYGIPEYRLPKAVLDREIKIMTDMGIRIMTGKRLGVHLRLEDLQRDFDAVYLALGSWKASTMHIEGENNPAVISGVQFLANTAKGKPMNLGPRVAVIGGGNTAIDCARTALRMGAEVKLIYRRTREEMPAAPYEIEEALHEGVEMLLLAAPTSVENNGEGVKLHCIRMELGEPDRSGRRRPVPVEGSEFEVAATTIIAAIGQSTDTTFLWNDLPVKLNRWGDVEINGRTMETSAAKVFSGGDCVTGPATVVQAVGAGHQAAEAIDRYLTMGYVAESPEDYACNRGTLEDLPRFEFESLPRAARVQMMTVPVAERITDFCEVETGLSRGAATAEARRCLRCGCSQRYGCDLRQEATRHAIEHKPPIGGRFHKPIVEDHPFIVRDHNKCISCARCVTACQEIEGPGVLGIYLKDGKLVIGTRSGKPLRETECVSCGQCVTSCPCGALDYKRESDRVFYKINDPNTSVIGFVAPAVRSVIAEKFGLASDDVAPFMAGLLKKMGFDKVFDFVFAADLTIVEETTEFLSRVGKGGPLPHFTSCCPGWVNYVERRYPQLIPHLSSCKSPQQMMGATVKNHYTKWAGLEAEGKQVFVVSIVPCLAKKQEAARPEFAPGGVRDVDAVLTTNELLEIISLTKLDTSKVPRLEFDEPYKHVSGAGVMFGVSGGVAEASLRMAIEKISGGPALEKLEFEEVRGLEGVKSTTVEAGGRQIRLAVVSGLSNAEALVQRVIAGDPVGFDLVEVMACPGGCIAGAGHPSPAAHDDLARRQSVLVEIDKHSTIRKSQENPDILRLYREFFGEANSELSHRLLHTHYRPYPFADDEKIRRQMDSAYRTRQIRVCVDEECQRKGSYQALEALREKIHALKLDHMVTVKPILSPGHSHNGAFYIDLDGVRVGEEEIEDLESFLKSLAPQTPTVYEKIM